MSTLEKIYEAQLKAQKEQLQRDHAAAEADLTYQKEQNQKATDTNLNRTTVEAQKAIVNQTELHNASGLSSGARAQARLAQENQLQADLTALRTAQQDADAQIERQRGILAQEYASAIRQAQAENDLAKATALYEQAQKEQQALQERELAAAQLMAQSGDYGRLAGIYGLSESEVAALKNAGSGTKTGGLTFSEALSYYKETGDASVLANHITTDQYIDLLGGTEEALGKASEIAHSLDDYIPQWKAQWDDTGVTNVLLSYINARIDQLGGLTDTEMAALYRYLKEKGYYNG